MDKALRTWRIVTLIVGYVFVLPSLVLFILQIQSTKGRQQVVSNGLILVYCVASGLGIIASGAMKRGSNWARAASWMTASIQVLAFPLFTLLGLFGLVLLATTAEKQEVRSKPTPTTSGAIAAQIVVTLTILWLFTNALFSRAKHLGYPAPEIWIGLAVFYVCIILHTFADAGALALAVKLTGGHVHLAQIGPFWRRHQSDRTWARYSWRLVSLSSIAWSSGTTRNLVRQRLFIAASVPLMKLAVVIVAFGCFWWIGDLGLSRIWYVPVVVMIASLGLLMVSLWPMTKGFSVNEAAVIRDLLSNHEFRRLTKITLAQSMSDSLELRPKDWSREDVEWSLALEDIAPFSPGRSTVLHNACAHYLDCGQPVEAVRIAHCFRDLALGHPKRCSQEGFAEAVFALAFYGKERESALDLWARRPATVPVQFELAERLAEAAIADERDRTVAIGKAWECSELYGSCGTLEYLRDQLRRLETNSRAASV